MSDPDLDLGALRALAVRVAYRMTGSRTEAEDLAQEAILRVRSAAGSTEVHSPEAFTTTVTTRLALDHLRSARVQRESYLGPWLPEPLLYDSAVEPADAAEVADEVSFAMLVVLESLQPAERAALVLHDVFGFSHAEVAEILGRSEPSSRQLVSRARRRVTAERPSVRIDAAAHRRVLEQFLAASRSGDVDQLVAVLADDAVYLSDGGPRRRAARHPIVGRDRVARFLAKVGPKVLGGAVEMTQINGELGLVVRHEERPVVACTVVVDAGLVRTVHWVLNPDKLAWV